ncbi:hypothetical protein CI238_04375 [Colletotrichum incanum]|uniref:Uncharacterized protein n=1 Tax=Colletotrichum incanum TaxID=1573173 RepID=A0A161VSV3_COLIC|nr:hypothetical protein CI238_04375 [Colletotrichum incanum]
MDNYDGSCAALEVIFENPERKLNDLRHLFKADLIENHNEIYFITLYTAKCRQDAVDFCDYVIEKHLGPKQLMAESKASAFRKAYPQLNTRHCAHVYTILALRAFTSWFYLGNDNHMVMDRSNNGWGCDTLIHEVRPSQLHSSTLPNSLVRNRTLTPTAAAVTKILRYALKELADVDGDGWVSSLVNHV